MNSLILIISASVLLSQLVTCKPLAEKQMHEEAANNEVWTKYSNYAICQEFSA